MIKIACDLDKDEDESGDVIKLESAIKRTREEMLIVVVVVLQSLRYERASGVGIPSRSSS